MSLPSPLPDDPRKWDGWRLHDSADFYSRLCLSFEARPTDQDIEEHSRQLLVWWQKKLPLKHQPGNPLFQLLRSGLDNASYQIAEARSHLLHREKRAEIDRAHQDRHHARALAEFKKYLTFALVDGVLGRQAEANLFQFGRHLGLHGDDLKLAIREGMLAVGAARESKDALVPQLPPQKQAPAHTILRPQKQVPAHTAMRPAANEPAPAVGRATPNPQPDPEVEKRRFPDFETSVGARMILVPSGKFLMGRQTPEAPINEQPATNVTLRCFHLAQYAVTNAEYEQFEPEHVLWRSPQAGDRHPVVYVTYEQATQYCEWLSKREGRKYRLPTEAEWEYASRGADGRIYPWAPQMKFKLAAFKLTSSAGAGSDPAVALPGHEPLVESDATEALPVGSRPQRASQFGIEDLSGNVWEWCQDYYGSYLGADMENPTGPTAGAERVCRGGSWKSPPASLKATTRGFNPPSYASNDLGFRIACETPRGTL